MAQDMQSAEAQVTKETSRFRSLLLRNPDQAILAIVMSAFREDLQSPTLRDNLRTIKDHFRLREYDQIFATDKNDIKRAYAVKYSTTRAMCYRHIFGRLWIHLAPNRNKTKVLAVGGGAGGEVIAWGAILGQGAQNQDQCLELTVIDYADWGDVLEDLVRTIQREWGVSNESLSLQTRVRSILVPTEQDHFGNFHLITFMFVMNELFVDGKRTDAMALLQRLATEMCSGALLLLVESAGSFSHVQVGNRSYMVYQLLDGLKDFDILEQSDAEWYRLPDNLRFPLQLENMRYLFRLYRRK